MSLSPLFFLFSLFVGFLFVVSLLFVFCLQDAIGVEYLIHAYPKFVTIGSIPLESNSPLDKVKCFCFFNI